MSRSSPILVILAIISVASVAQLVEQLTLNQLVLGSSPSRGTTSLNFFADDWRLVSPLKKAETPRLCSLRFYPSRFYRFRSP